jgi:hypothetical protein
MRSKPGWTSSQVRKYSDDFASSTRLRATVLLIQIALKSFVQSQHENVRFNKVEMSSCVGSLPLPGGQHGQRGYGADECDGVEMGAYDSVSAGRDSNVDRP